MRNEQDRMVRAQKRLLRARIGYGQYRAAQRAWARARSAQRRAWAEKARIFGNMDVEQQGEKS